MSLIRVPLVGALGALALLLLAGSAHSAGNNDSFSTSPTLNGDKRWRVAYYEGGPDDNYYFYLEATIRGLMGLGWIEQQPLPPEGNRDPIQLWSFLTTKAKSQYGQRDPQNGMWTYRPRHLSGALATMDGECLC